MERKIDLATWQRKDLFAFFTEQSHPFYMVTFRQDVTNLRRYARAHGLSFYYSLIYLCCEAVNRVEAFRYTIRGGEVYRLDGRRPSFTDLRPGSECFHIVTLPGAGTLPDFVAAAKQKSAAQRVLIEPAEERDDLIYFSSLPWVDLTALTNERDLSAPGARDDSVPRIAWGRYTEEGDRVTLGLSMEVNHRLIDGIHIGRFAEELTRLIDGLPS